MEQNNQQPPVFNNQGLQEPNMQYEELPIMGFKEAVKTCFAKYATFTGRARRSEYWWFCLFMVLLSMVCSIIDGVLKATCDMEFVDTVASLFVVIPSVSVSFRRLHDIGRSGWWAGASYILLAISIIVILVFSQLGVMDLFNDDKVVDAMMGMNPVAWLPIVVSIILSLVIFVFSLMDSQRGENKYGPSPKYQ